MISIPKKTNLLMADASRVHSKLRAEIFGRTRYYPRVAVCITVLVCDYGGFSLFDHDVGYTNLADGGPIV